VYQHIADTGTQRNWVPESITVSVIEQGISIPQRDPLGIRIVAVATDFVVQALALDELGEKLSCSRVSHSNGTETENG